jgi:hypothetical protein
MGEAIHEICDLDVESDNEYCTDYKKDTINQSEYAIKY